MPLDLAQPARLAPGLHPDVAEEIYHADCAVKPSLSGSLAKLFHTHSAWHVWHKHPRLNPKWTLEPGKVRTDIGSVAHTLLFGTGKRFAVLDHKDFKKDVAKAERDACHRKGIVPIIRDKYESLLPMAEACREQIKGTEHEDIFAPGGQAEVTFIVEEPNGAALRCRTDWVPASALRGGHIKIVDYKTTERSANPNEWQRILWDKHMDLQAAMNERIIRQVLPDVRTLQFVYLVQEWTPPYAVSFVEIGVEGLEQAHEKVSVSIDAWLSCLAANSWPGYPRTTVAVEPALWRKSQHVQRKMALYDLIRAMQEPDGIPHDPETGEILDDRPRDAFGLLPIEDARAAAVEQQTQPDEPIEPEKPVVAPQPVGKLVVREPEIPLDEDDDIGDL